MSIVFILVGTELKALPDPLIDDTDLENSNFTAGS